MECGEDLENAFVDLKREEQLLIQMRDQLLAESQLLKSELEVCNAAHQKVEITSNKSEENLAKLQMKLDQRGGAETKMLRCPVESLDKEVQELDKRIEHLEEDVQLAVDHCNKQVMESCNEQLQCAATYCHHGLQTDIDPIKTELPSLRDNDRKLESELLQVNMEMNQLLQDETRPDWELDIPLDQRRSILNMFRCENRVAQNQTTNERREEAEIDVLLQELGPRMP